MRRYVGLLAANLTADPTPRRDPTGALSYFVYIRLYASVRYCRVLNGFGAYIQVSPLESLMRRLGGSQALDSPLHHSLALQNLIHRVKKSLFAAFS